MPAASELPDLPATWRPLGVRIAIVFFGAMLLIVCGATWFAMDPEIREKISTLQRVTIALLVLGAGWGCWVLGRCRVTAEERGVRVVNGLRNDVHPWGEIAGVVMKPGMPWARLALRDGTVRQLIALQSSDGARAARAVLDLRALVEERSGR